MGSRNGGGEPFEMRRCRGGVGDGAIGTQGPGRSDGRVRFGDCVERGRQGAKNVALEQRQKRTGDWSSSRSSVFAPSNGASEPCIGTGLSSGGAPEQGPFESDGGVLGSARTSKYGGTADAHLDRTEGLQTISRKGRCLLRRAQGRNPAIERHQLRPTCRIISGRNARSRPSPVRILREIPRSTCAPRRSPQHKPQQLKPPQGPATLSFPAALCGAGAGEFGVGRSAQSQHIVWVVQWEYYLV